MLKHILWAGTLAGLALTHSVGRPAFRGSLVRHHPLCRLHEVRQPRIRAARHQRPEFEFGRVWRRGDAGSHPGHRARRECGLLPAKPRDRRTADRRRVGGPDLGPDVRRRTPAARAGDGGASDFAVRAGRRGLCAAVHSTSGPATTHATNFAYNVGAGADVAIGPRLGLQVMAKDYIGKFDVREATAVNVDTKTTHNWAVSAGLRLGL